jgi:hypothetical protein
MLRILVCAVLLLFASIQLRPAQGAVPTPHIESTSLLANAVCDQSSPGCQPGIELIIYKKRGGHGSKAGKIKADEDCDPWIGECSANVPHKKPGGRGSKAGKIKADEDCDPWIGECSANVPHIKPGGHGPKTGKGKAKPVAKPRQKKPD